jgi:hypothetical protein
MDVKAFESVVGVSELIIEIRKLKQLHLSKAIDAETSGRWIEVMINYFVMTLKEENKQYVQTNKMSFISWLHEEAYARNSIKDDEHKLQEIDGVEEVETEMISGQQIDKAKERREIGLMEQHVCNIRNSRKRYLENCIDTRINSKNNAHVATMPMQGGEMQVLRHQGIPYEATSSLTNEDGTVLATAATISEEGYNYYNTGTTEKHTCTKETQTNPRNRSSIGSPEVPEESKEETQQSASEDDIDEELISEEKKKQNSCS